MSKVQRRGGSLAVIAAALALTISGCVTPDPVETPPPTATDDPVFASEEEALAAAEQAYADYITAGDAAASGDSGDLERYLSLTTGEAHEQDKASAEEFEAAGWTSVGSPSFDTFSVKSFESLSGSTSEIRTYLCLDVSGTDVVDANGVSVISPTRPLRLPLEVTFVTTSSQDPSLLISESSVWSGTNFC